MKFCRGCGRPVTGQQVLAALARMIEQGLTAPELLRLRAKERTRHSVADCSTGKREDETDEIPKSDSSYRVRATGTGAPQNG